MIKRILKQSIKFSNRYHLYGTEDKYVESEKTELLKVLIIQT
jgi:hypothetical protein